MGMEQVGLAYWVTHGVGVRDVPGPNPRELHPYGHGTGWLGILGHSWGWCARCPRFKSQFFSHNFQGNTRGGLKGLIIVTSCIKRYSMSVFEHHILAFSRKMLPKLSNDQFPKEGDFKIFSLNLIVYVCCWSQENAPQDEQPTVFTENTYIKVIGNIRTFGGKRSIGPFKILPVTDLNEMTMHMLEVVHSHMLLTKMAATVMIYYLFIYCIYFCIPVIWMKFVAVESIEKNESRKSAYFFII